MRCIIIIVQSLLHFNLKICALHIHWNIHEPAHWYAISRNHTRTHTWHTHTDRKKISQQLNCHLQYHTMYDAIGDLGGLLGSELSSPPLLSSSKRNCALQHFKTRTPTHTPTTVYWQSLSVTKRVFMNDTVVLHIVDNAMEKYNIVFPVKICCSINWLSLKSSIFFFTFSSLHLLSMEAHFGQFKKEIKYNKRLEKKIPTIKTLNLSHNFDFSYHNFDGYLINKTFYLVFITLCRIIMIFLSYNFEVLSCIFHLHISSCKYYVVSHHFDMLTLSDFYHSFYFLSHNHDFLSNLTFLSNTLHTILTF